MVQDNQQELPFKGAKYFTGSDHQVGILLLHAYTGSTRDMNLLGRLLNRQGYSVLIPLFSGHDTQDIRNVLNYSPRIWQQEARSVLEWLLQQGFKQVFVFGLSMGGVLAGDLLSLHRYPLAGGGVFNAPLVTKEPIDISQAFMNLGEKLARIRGEQADYMEEYDHILAGHWQQMAELEQIKQEIQPRLPQVNLPFYIGQSGQDELIDPQDAYLLKAHLSQAEVDFHYFPYNTHSISTNPKRHDFDQSVLAFLQALT